MVTNTKALMQGGMTKDQNATPTVNDVTLEGTELLEAIKKQVEYYMSKENLTQDQFLVSKMDKNYYVELSVIADFHLVKVLTRNEADEKLIIEAVKFSKKVAIDEGGTKVRPANINARTTLILRNIPSSKPEAEVISFLEKAGLPTIVGVRSDVGDNWFATFESEEAAKEALALVRPLKWEDKSIGCALKTENLLKGIVPGALPTSGPGMAQLPGYYQVPVQYQSAPYGYGYQAEGQGVYRSRGQGNRRGPGGPEAVKDGAQMGGGTDGQRRGPKKGKGRNGKDGREGDDSAAQQPPINLSEFPSLAQCAKKEKNVGVKERDTNELDKRAPEAPESAKDATTAANEQPSGPDPSSGNSDGTASENGSASEQLSTNHAPIKKKLSYAEMAQAIRKAA